MTAKRGAAIAWTRVDFHFIFMVNSFREGLNNTL